MHLSLHSSNYLQTFAGEYSPPYWEYVVKPRVPEDAPYFSALDFAEYPLAEIAPYVQENDVLEVFLLNKRVLLKGVQVQVMQPAPGVVLQPVMRTGVVFTPVDCSALSANTYLLGGGILDRTTNVLAHSLRIEEPDYFGFRIIGSAVMLDSLALHVTLVADDIFSLNTPSNSTKK